MTMHRLYWRINGAGAPAKKYRRPSFLTRMQTTGNMIIRPRGSVRCEETQSVAWSSGIGGEVMERNGGLFIRRSIESRNWCPR